MIAVTHQAACHGVRRGSAQRRSASWMIAVTTLLGSSSVRVARAQRRSASWMIAAPGWGRGAVAPVQRCAQRRSASWMTADTGLRPPRAVRRCSTPFGVVDDRGTSANGSFIVTRRCSTPFGVVDDRGQLAAKRADEVSLLGCAQRRSASVDGSRVDGRPVVIMVVPTPLGVGVWFIRKILGLQRSRRLVLNAVRRRWMVRGYKDRRHVGTILYRGSAQRRWASVDGSHEPSADTLGPAISAQRRWASK